MNSANFKKDVDRIKIPEDRLEETIQMAMKNGRPKRNFGKKIAYVASAAALSVCLLFGSASVSPALADTLAKVPILGSVFQLGDLGQEISDELKEKGYKASVGLSYPEKVVQIWVDGSEQYLADVKDDVQKIVEDFLRSKQYDAYTIIVDRDDRDLEDVEISEQQKQTQETLNELMDTLKKNGYETGTVGYGDEAKKIGIQIEGSEEYYNEVKDEVLDTVNEVLQGTTLADYTVQLSRKTEHMVKEEQWGGIVSSISDEILGKKGYQASGIAFAMDEGSMKLIVRTSLKSSDPDAKEIAEGIEGNVIKMLESEQFKPLPGPYEIKVYSEDKKIMN